MEIKTLLRFNKIVPIKKARLLMGPAGIGKSSVIKMIADEDGARLIDIRLSEFEPQDFVGLPYLENGPNGKITKFAQPYWWPTDPEEKVHLLLDEIDRCSEDLQPSAMQLTLDRRAGGRTLPDNVTVWAACNGEGYITSLMDQALMDRFVVATLTPSVSEWLEWAKNNDVHNSVIGFIESNPKNLDTPENMIGKPNVVCVSRRSWSDLGKAFNGILELETETNLLQYAAAYVGFAAAAAYVRWVKENYKTINPKDIYRGVLDSKEYNILQISCSSEEAAAEFLTSKRKQQRNCLDFYMAAGHEAFASFFEALPDEASIILSSFKDVDQFISNARRPIVRNS